MSVLTPNQELLADYLTAIGMSVIQRLVVITELWEPEATLEMLQYIAETEDSNVESLYRVSAEIARKYPDNSEEGDE